MALKGRRWRGNIRELENVVERCMLFCDGDRIEVEHLPTEPGDPATSTLATSTISAPPSPGEGDGGTDLKEAVREAAARVERELIVRALDKTGGNVTHTARLLKISRKSLQNKMKDLGLRQE
jgi:DNA-binding NtrC family response regulator